MGRSEMGYIKHKVGDDFAWRFAPAWALHCIFTVVLLAPQQSHAAKGVPMPACAKELFSCAADSAQTLGQSVLTVGKLIGHAVANAECVAAMASGSPVAIGVTGLVLGLGASGVVSPTSCEAGIYGPAIIPVGAALDAVLGTSLSSKLAGATLDAAMMLIQPIPVPAVPPTVGGLIDCGCGALEAGAQTVEDIRKVAKFAAQAVQSCGAAIKSCPGLKEAAFVAKTIVRLVKDPSCVVQDSDSMSRIQYIDARLRDLIPHVTTQMKNNVPWSGSDMEVNHWIPRKKACYAYYTDHCMTDGESESFCNGAVWEENFDPMVWSSIIEELNGSQFDAYFNANVKQFAPATTCPKDPGVAINLDPNAVSSLEQAKAAQSANAKACQQEVAALISGDKDSLKSFAHDLLPTTREGWSDVRLKPAEKPMDNAKKVYQRLLTASAVVIKVKMDQVGAKYQAQDAALAQNASNAAVPYLVLNTKYAYWGATAILFNMTRCPPDPKGWASKYDLQCVQELVSSVGFQATTASQSKLDGVVVAEFEAQINKGSFKGSKYYNVASDVLLNTKRPPRIKVPGSPPETAEQMTDRYTGYWPDAAKAATAIFLADMDGFFGKQFERVAENKATRKTQDDTFAALARDNKIEGDYAKTVCDKLKTGAVANALPQLCSSKIAEITADEASKFNISKAGAFLNISNPAMPAAESSMAKAVTSIKADHLQSLRRYALVHQDFKVDSKRSPLEDGPKKAGDLVKDLDGKKPLVQGGSSGATSGRAAVAADPSKGIGGSGPVIAPEIGARTAVIPPRQPDPAPGGRIGMPGLPTMGAIPNFPKTGALPQGVTSPAVGAASSASGNVVVGSGKVAIDQNGFGNPGPGNLNDLAKTQKLPDRTLIGVAGTTPPPTGGAPAIVAGVPDAKLPTGGLIHTMPPGGTLPAAAAPAPFNASLYRKEREVALNDKWLGQCKSAACRQAMTVLIAQRIDAEVQRITAGNPDHNNKAAVEAFIRQTDQRLDPQFQTEVNKSVPATMAAPPPTVVVPNATQIGPKLPKGFKPPGQ